MLGPGPTASSVRDRTTEFFSIAERLRRSQGASAGPYSSQAAATAAAPRAASPPASEFARRAAAAGAAIGKASSKLQRLSGLAKQTSMFDDPSAQIDELTGIIKAEITQITEAISGLQQLAARGGGGGQQSEAHASSVVENLRGRLKDVTAEFKEVLTVRSEALKAHDQRRQLFSSQPEPPVFSEQAPLLLAPDGSASRSASTLFGGQVRQRRGDTSSQQPPYGSPGGIGSSSSSPYQQQQMQQQQQQQQQQQRGYVSSRAEALSSVEATIVELGSMFTQLAELVTSQGEMAARIDENIDETLGHVEGARTQLMRYLDRMSSNRGLLIKVLLVLMALMAVFIIFVA